MNQKRILIGDTRPDFGIVYANALRNRGYYTFTRSGSRYQIFHAIETECPDLVIIGAMSSSTDVIWLLKHLCMEKMTPKLIVLTGYCDPYLHNQFFELGVNEVLQLPITAETLADRAEKLFQKECPDQEKELEPFNRYELEVMVTDMIHRLGIPAHIQGYYYLREAVVLSIGKPELLNSIMHELYPAVAERFSTTASRVERSIRHAIELAWGRGNPEALSEFCGYPIHLCRTKPSNSECIAILTDQFRLQTKVRMYRKSS